MTMIETESAPDEREVILRAASAYDGLRAQIDALTAQLTETGDRYAAQLTEARDAIRSRDTQIGQLELALAEERNRSATLQADRDQAVLERGELLAVFHMFRAQLEAITIPMPPLPTRATRRRKNGEGVVDLAPVEVRS